LLPLVELDGNHALLDDFVLGVGHQVEHDFVCMHHGPLVVEEVDLPEHQASDGTLSLFFALASLFEFEREVDVPVLNAFDFVDELGRRQVVVNLHV